MKFSIKYLLFAMAIAVLASCSNDETHDAVFDGTNSSNQSLIAFAHENYKFQIPKDNSTQLDVEVTTSTLSKSDRTFAITVVDSLTTAEPNTYSVPATVTIPAGKYIGHLLVDGEDHGPDVTSQSQTITLTLANSNNYSNTVMGTTKTELDQVQVCPIPSDFLVGDYLLENVQETLGPSNDTHNLGEGVVSLSIGDSPNERIFKAVPLPGFGTPTEFTLQLNCGIIIFEQMAIGVQCDSGIEYGPAPENQDATYDPNNEQNSYTITYNQDVTNDCGGNEVASFKLTKQ